MDKAKLSEYRKRLTEELKRLKKSLNRNRIAVDEFKVEHTEDEGDLASISHNRELLYNLNETDVVRLKSIEAALKRISAGQYGECISCEEDINDKRLAAVPWVALCIRCQEEIETEHASTRYSSASSDSEPPEM